MNYQPRWGDTFTPTNKNNNIRIIYQNANGLATSRTTEFNKTTSTIAATISLQPDALAYSETNVFWGNATMLRATKQCFTAVYGQGSLQCAHNTHFTPRGHYVYPDALTGGVCQWVNPSLTPRITHTDTDHLGRFAAALIHGPAGQALHLITAYRPVVSDGPFSVMKQQKKFLGANSDPREAILQDLQKIVSAAHRANDTVILCMDANETIPEMAPIIATGILKFCRDAGLVDALSTLHGHCPINSCNKSSGSPIDFIFCSPDLIPHIRVGMLNEAQGSDSDHFAYGIDINEHSLWQTPALVNPLIRRRGFSTENNLKTRNFVTTLYDLIKNSNIKQLMAQAQEEISAGEDTEKIGGLLDEADEIMTKGMIDAEMAMRPSNKAASHCWSPELVRRQRMAALGTRFARARKKPMSSPLRATFEAEAKAIDPEWKLPVHGGTAMAKWVEALAKQAKKAKRNQQKLRKEFLEQQLRDSVSAMEPEEQQEAIKTIMTKDKMRQNHKIIQRRLKQARTQLKSVIGEDGQRISGSEMPTAFVTYNAHHFQQPIRNGATAADGRDFCNGLRAYRTTEEDLSNNTYVVLRGEIAEPTIKESEVPFYESIRCVPQPLTTIREAIPFNEFKRYWATIVERKSSSPSGRHVGLYKSLAKDLGDRAVADQQEFIREYIRLISNLCIRTGYILQRWRLATDVMLQKKVDNINISKMRTIRLMEADLNQVLKWASREIMREIEKRPDGLSDMQFGFRKHRTTHQAILSTTSMIDIAHQARIGFATADADCRAAFDCVIPEIIRLALIAKGVPEKMVRFMYSHLTQTKFQVCAGGFTSDEQYGGEDQSFGSGQGGGASGANWVLNQDFINRALEAAESQASIIRHPITHEIATNNGIVFADDLNQVSMDTTRKRSDAENLESLRKAAQLNNDCLRASGGSLNIQKCAFRHLSMNNKGKCNDVPNSAITIIPSTNSVPQPIARMLRNQHQRILGVHIAPSLKTTAQYDILEQKCKVFKTAINNNPLHPSHLRIATNQYIHPSIGYPLVAQRLTTARIDKLQGIPLAATLGRVNLSTKMSRALVFLPASKGGAGMIQWSSVNLARQIQLVTTTYNSPSNIGFLLRTSLAITQLEYGHGASIMATLDSDISGTTETWWTVLHLNCCKANIRLEGGWTASLQRYYDYFIAELPAKASINMQKHQWKLFREMFVYLNITTMADIVTACGQYITKEAEAGKKSYESINK